MFWALCGNFSWFVLVLVKLCIVLCWNSSKYILFVHQKDANAHSVMKRSGQILLCGLFLCLIISCEEGTKSSSHFADLPEIIESGELVAITSYSPISYFVYRGEAMGYEYELLQLYGEHLGLPVIIKLARDFDEMIEMLERGEGDMIAYALTITSERREHLAFTDPFNTTRQVLVQRKPEGWRQMMLHRIEQMLVRNPIELAGDTVHVRRGSAYVSRLRNLSSEIGSDIQIVEAGKGVTTEELISMVAEGQIRYTVADENIAAIQSAYYRDLDVSTAISLPQQTAWALRPSSVLLIESLNGWLEEARNEVDFYVIYNKYFENRRAFRSRYASDYFLIAGGKISPYDELFRANATRLGWDWRLFAALAYQESRFDPDARSWAGAIGIMQLMPRTALEFGAADPYNPVQNVAAGAAFISWLDDYWKQHIENPDERLLFVIASYNAGHGHVQDARRLAAAHHVDPDIWHGHVENYMLKKSNPEYYNREEVRYGYASGIEPVNYVNNILEIYNHYKLFVE